jgi:phosphoadenosine phosphosulfate reductase
MITTQNLALISETPHETTELSSVLSTSLGAKLAHVRELLVRELPRILSSNDACLTCSFQAEDVLLLHLVREHWADIPVLFLDTGYHFDETYAYRNRITADWKLNLINLLPVRTVAEQELEHGLLNQTAPDRCCALRKVEPLFSAVGNYKVWLTGLRREQARSRAALEEAADFTLPNGITVRKLSPFADWTTREVWLTCAFYGIPLLPLYDVGYTSIGCKPCTSIPTDPNDPRSGRWAGNKVECGIHIEVAPNR